MTSDWNPSTYLRFASERQQPALDLLQKVRFPVPQSVVDLGCGPGNSTAMLCAAFPESVVTGVDASPAMIVAARAAVPGATFVQADVAQWRPQPTVDLVFSNALFQWVPNHGAVLVHLLAALRAGARLAVQMPDNLDEPSHRLMPETMHHMGLKTESDQAVASRSSLLDVTGYHDLLQPLAAELRIWRTTYYHPLAGHQGIVDMLSSTGLRPFVDRVPELRQAEFLAHYKAGLERAYPVAADGRVLFPFPRLFIVAVRGGADVSPSGS